MSKHPDNCPCVVCKPVRCVACHSANPDLIAGVCRHRRACEARQMLRLGESQAAAAAHAQGLVQGLEGERHA